MSFFGSSTATAVSAPPIPSIAVTSSSGDRDVEISEPPTDSVSSIAFSPQANYLAVGSWDNSVRIYEVSASGQAQGKAMYQHQAPVLSVCWNKDGNKIFSGGGDNAGRVYDTATGQAVQVAQHDAPIRVVRWVDAAGTGILATGSWDKTLKYWDLRAPVPVASVSLPERCYSFDVQFPLMVVGTAERHIQIYNLNNPSTPYKTLSSPLKWQTRVVSCFPPDAPNSGFAVGSVEGRVAIQYVEDKDSALNFAFKCHRRDSTPDAKDQAIIFAVNDISFNPVHGTFSTCGSDGVVNFWDKDARQRLKTFDSVAGPITTTAFNHNGTIFAYAVSYDWSRGHTGNTAEHATKIMLHACKEEEVKKRPRK